MDNLEIVVSNFNKEISIIKEINSIKKAGFKKVFIQWYNRNWPISQEEQFLYAQKIGLDVKKVHLGYDEINDLWSKNGDYLVERYINDLKICQEKGIDLVMMHITGKNTPPYNKMGLERIKKIVKYAEKVKIKIALENVEDPNYLEYVLTNVKSDFLGICFDSGHYHCYFQDKFSFQIFKNKIFAVHLHDNHGLKDEHLLPFDGNVDWLKIAQELKKSNYLGPIILEVIYQSDYLKMTIDEFYQKAYEVGLKLEKIFK